MNSTLIELITSVLGAVPPGFEFLLYSFGLFLLFLSVFTVFSFILILFSKFLKF